MKKSLKLTSAAFLAVSALTPVAVFANETTTETPANGFYTADKYVKSLSELSRSEVKALLKGKVPFVLVANGIVYDINSAESALLLLTAETVEDLADIAQTYEEYKESGKELSTEGGIVDSNEGEEPIIGELTVESVTAVNAKTLEVTFNTEAEVTAESFTVTKGSVKANVAKVTIAEDKKSAKIELTSKLTEGEYTVTVAQEGKDALTGNVKVENEKLSKIEILTEEAVVTTVGTLDNGNTTDDKATTTVKITNQYGEDITKLNTGVSIVVAGAGTGHTFKATGELELNIKDTAKIGDSVIVTIVDPATGVSATKTLKLSDASTPTEVAFGELYNKDGKTLSQDTDLSKDKFYLPVVVKDQYGKEITDSTKAGKVTVTNANDAVIKVSALKTVKINDKDTLVVEITNVGLAGTSNVVAVSLTSGKSSQASVTVASGVKVSSLTVSAPTELVTENKDVYFPLTVVDTNGNEVKSTTELNKIKDTVTVSGANIVDKNAKNETGLFVKVTNDGTNVKEGQALTVVVTSTSGKVSTQTVVPKAEAKATVITGISAKLPTSLLTNNTDGITVNNTDLTVEDQYGQVITDETALQAITFTATADTAGVFTLTPSVDNKSVEIGVADPNSTVKSAKITFALESADAKEVAASAFVKSYSIVEGTGFASYEVEDLPKIYAETTADSVKVKAEYAKEFTVKGKTAAGEVVTLVKDTDYSVKGLLVAGNAVTFEKDATEAKVKAVITINATGEQIVKEVTYSKVKPVAASFIFTAKDAVDAEKAKALTGIQSVVGTTADTATIAKVAKVVVTDSYGKKDFAAADTLQVTIVPSDATKVTVGKNGTKDANVALKAGVEEALVTFKVTVDNVTTEIQVKLVKPSL